MEIQKDPTRYVTMQGKTVKRTFLEIKRKNLRVHVFVKWSQVKKKEKR